MKEALKKTFTNPFTIIVLIALMLIPTIYNAIFLGSIWDPYGKMDLLPVAVVNQDKTVKYNGKKVHVGKTLSKNLVKNKPLDFHREDSMATARKKLKNGDYYMIVRIPKNFSKHAVSVLDKTPKKAAIHYYTNPAKSFMGTKFSESAVTRIKSAVSTQVTKSYADAMVKVVKSSTSGMKKAADGSKQINDGTIKLKDGSGEITDNLNKLASSTLTFVSGSDKLNVGLKKYTAGVSSAANGSKSLTDGSAKLANGTGTLENGANKYVQGVDTYSNAVNQYVQGADQLSNGVSQLKQLEDLGQVSSAVNQLSYGVNGQNNPQSLKAGSHALNEGLKQISASVDAMANSSSAADLQKLSTTLNQSATVAEKSAEALQKAAPSIKAAQDSVNNASTQINTIESEATNNAIDSAIATVNNDQSISDAQKATLTNALNSQKVTPDKVTDTQMAKAVKTALTQTATGLGQLNEATASLQQASTVLGQVSKGLASSNSGSAADGIKQLQTALKSASAGAETLDKGVDTLGSKMNQLGTATAKLPQASNGIKTLVNGAGTLSSNSGKLTNGSKQIQQSGGALTSGVSSLSNGATQLASGSAKLQSGLNQIAQNNNTLLSGQAQLSAGAGKIADGSSKLAAGSGQVTQNLGKLQTGAATLSKGLNNSAKSLSKHKFTGKTANMFAKPVKAKETKMTHVGKNGYGMAPYMMSVGMWIVCIAGCMMFPVLKRDENIKNGVEWWASKSAVFYPLEILSAFVMFGLLNLILGFSPMHWDRMFLTAIIGGAAFMSIFLFLNVALGPTGSYIGLLLTVLQLSASGGTYPLEVSSHYAAYVHAYMPFTYTVDAFRSGIAGNTSITHDMVVLGGIAIVFAILSLLIFIARDHSAKKKAAKANDNMQDQAQFSMAN